MIDPETLTPYVDHDEDPNVDTSDHSIGAVPIMNTRDLTCVSI